MKTTRRQFLTGAIGLGGAVALGAPRSEAAPGPFPELETGGSPGTMGMAHGKSFAPQVKHNVAFYVKYLSGRTGRKPAEILAIAHTFRRVLTEHVPELLEEMEGIAKGAGTPLDEILAVNARTDLLVLGRRKTRPKAETSAAVPGCTALALEQLVGGRPQLALGQNWDWDRALRKNTILLRLTPTAGPAVVTFTEAGMVGKIGMNDRRLGVCLNFLRHPSDDPQRPPGVPVHCLLRAVMGCESLDHAVRLVRGVPRCASANFLTAQFSETRPEARDLEWTPTAVACLELEDGILVHTNHFKDQRLGHDIRSGNSFQRDARAQRAAAALREQVPDPAERMQRILSLGDEHPVSLSRPSTQAGIVMDLGRNRLHVCIGPPHRGRWIARPGV